MIDFRKNLRRALCLMLAWSFCTVALLAQTGEISVRGQVLDQSGGAVPAITVNIVGPNGATKSVQTNEEGKYVFRNLPPGAYTVRITLKGFADFVQSGVVVAPGQPQVVDAHLVVALEKQEVTVQSDVTQVSVSAENNASSLVIKGKDLEALSDDPDELQSDLEALAGPSAGPNGGQIYIDGFTGGQLPPKSAILEVRVNQNPFSAEYDRLGYGRVEITTKPGYAQYHGQFFVNGNASGLNSRNPFATVIPAYHSEIFDGNFGGPLGKSKKASFFFDGQRRNIQDESIVSAEILDSNFNPIPFSEAVPHPQTRTELSPRADFQLSNNNVLTIRYQNVQNNQTNNGIGQFSLASLGYNSDITENSLQLSDTQVVSARTANQIRFRYARTTNNQLPLSLDPTIGVLGAFTNGGYSGGKNLDTVNSYEFQNLTSITFGKHSVVFGGRLRDSDESNSATGGFNGGFTFPTLLAYQITEQGLQQGLSPAQIRAAGGGATQFSLTAGNPLASVSLFDVGVYGQDDWRVRSNMTLSLGLRFESQNDIGDHADWAPRVGFAWGLGHSAKPSTVLRAGFGFFYDRFGQGGLLQAERLNGITQQQYVVPNPIFQIDPITGLACITPACVLGAGATFSSSLPTTYRIDPNLRAPYTMQSAIGVERQLTKNATMSVTYLHARGVHQLLTNDINAPLPDSGYDPFNPTSGVRPFGNAAGNIYQYETVGLFNQNQVIATFSVRKGARLSLNGWYTLNYANGNTSAPMNPYDIAEDYGRAAFDVRHRFFFIGSLTLPRGFRLNPFLMASSGAPFNITVGQDLFGTSRFNSRPALVAAGTTGPNIIGPTPFGTFDTLPLPGEPLISPYYGTGPSQFSLNMRFAKTFGFGEKKEAGGSAGGLGGPGGFGGGGPRGGGPPGGGLGGRGLGGGGGMGGFFGGGAPSNAPYNLEFSVNARNLLNNVNLGTPVRNLGSRLFGQSNSLAGQGFGGGSASNRRIELAVRFSF